MTTQPPCSPTWKERTELPEYTEALEEIKAALRRDRSLGLLLVDASSLHRIEMLQGRKVYRDVMTFVADLMSRFRGTVLRGEDLITVNRPRGDQFYVFLHRKREEKAFYSTDLEGLTDRLANELNKRVFDEVFHYLKGRPNITVGHGIVIHNPLIDDENLIERLIEDAKTMARFRRFRNEVRDKEKLQEIIIKEDLTTLFQPIVELGSGSVVGYEALSRGPRGTEYENPYFLFDTAREIGLIFELDRICRKKALLNSAWLDPDKKLFVNCMPTTLHDPEFRGTYLDEFLNDVRRRPHNVVIEVSEREAIEDYSLFREALTRYSDLGFSIAVDDTGAGYSSLEAIVELQPHYLKLDISMVRGIDTHLLKQEMIRAILAFSKKVNATIIAEGIETAREHETMQSLGVPLGQGFLFGRPAVAPEREGDEADAVAVGSAAVSAE